MNALKAIVLATLVVPLLAVAGFAQETDVEGSKDHPLLTRMPGYYISRYEETAFDGRSGSPSYMRELNGLGADALADEAKRLLAETMHG